MKTFFKFIQNIRGDDRELYTLKKNLFFEEKDVICCNSDTGTSDIRLIKILIDMFLIIPFTQTVKKKYGYLKTVLDNNFLTDMQKLFFLRVFQVCQTRYHVLTRFVFRYRWQKSPLKIEMDLFMSPISVSQHNVITILQNNQKYLFTVNDLKTIIDTALCNTYMFYSEPLPIKNPYNNMIFDKAILYNIYFFIKRGYFIESEVFHKYFLANFNLNAFRKLNEVIIRERHIDSEANSDDLSMLYEIAVVMLKENKYTKKLKIDPKFPKKILIDILRPYIKLYMKKIYSLDLFAKYACEYELKRLLKEFACFNPKFGRRIIKVNVNRTIAVSFNLDHVKFIKENSLVEFHNSHLEVGKDYVYDMEVLQSDSETDTGSDSEIN